MAARKRKQVATSDNRKRKVDILYADIHDILPYANNPRDNEQAIQSVANSIKTFGFVVPIIVDKDNVIVAGHTRYAASQLLGLSEVPIIIAEHLTPDQIAQFRLIDNKVSELARWDFDMLAGEITMLQDSGIDFTQFGWSPEEIDCLTDVVADDCLSAGSVASMDAAERGRRSEKRAPNNTRLVVGEFVLFIPTVAYRRWSEELRVNCNYDEADINNMIKDRLGITPYLTEQ
jgi:hypothetical protein